MFTLELRMTLRTIVSFDSGITDFVVVIMELLRFGSGVWRECILRVKVLARVVLEDTSRVTWSWVWLTGGC